MLIAATDATDDLIASHWNYMIQARVLKQSPQFWEQQKLPGRDESTDYVTVQGAVL